ncbi:hypothetical protein RAZWK3B_05927 [Roseobacter sp. AzwK-3b]|uniref:hypothetical protein n=1 Tax=Roseobacter sp. AzwK-3b TaxID=351016 RepID=UPI000156ABB4|nr:hypothetical protein [Roseobacter sp. AzwK-3b]EDM69526.1 hypothetical protein RAZWK3B_05927 [Roseobacter sp. AzwK-3b]
MTSARQITANRANAQKSTGPRTQTGKTKAAGNARRHGLTSAPPLDLVRAWLRVILDTTEAPPLIDLKQTERGRLALNLAMAEAHLRHLSVQNVRRLAEAEEPDPIYKWVELLEDDCAHFSWPKEAVRYLVRLRMREHKQNIARMARLHKRYTKEAMTARNRAFRAWVAWHETNLVPEL